MRENGHTLSVVTVQVLGVWETSTNDKVLDWFMPILRHSFLYYINIVLEHALEHALVECDSVTALFHKRNAGPLTCTTQDKGVYGKYSCEPPTPHDVQRLSEGVQVSIYPLLVWPSRVLFDLPHPPRQG